MQEIVPILAECHAKVLVGAFARPADGSTGASVDARLPATAASRFSQRLQEVEIARLDLRQGHRDSRRPDQSSGPAYIVIP